MWGETLKTSRVYVQNFPVCTGNTSTCINSCGRRAGTHGDVLNGHTLTFWTDTHHRERERETETQRKRQRERKRERERERGRGGSSSVLLTKFCPRRVITWMLSIFSLRIGREQHVAESSIYSLHLNTLFNSRHITQ